MRAICNHISGLGVVSIQSYYMYYNCITMMQRAALYLRVSTLNKDQKTDSQAFALEEYCKARGYTIFRRYEDVGISGAKSSRPELDELMADAAQKKFDLVIVFRFDRFARNTAFLLKAMEYFKGLGIGFCSVSEALDTNTPMGQAMFTIIGALGALERATTVERIKAGLEAARSKGRRIGRPLLRDDEKIFELKRHGLSIRKIAAQLGISKGSVQAALTKYQNVVEVAV